MIVRGDVFEQVAVEGVARAVIDQVEGLIVAGVLRSGQKMPAERELAETLGVSRPKLREALADLEARGLIVTRHGDGTYVANLTGAALSAPMVELFARHPQAFFDYLEYRRESEGFAAFLAASRATAADRAILTGIIAEMEAAHADSDPTREADIDVEFHLAIADAAHNALLNHMMASIYALMMRGVFYNRDALYGREGARDRLLAQHKAIAEAILARDPERAAAAAEAHIAFVQLSFQGDEAQQERERIARKRLALFESEPHPTTGRRRRNHPADRAAIEASAPPLDKTRPV